MCLEKTGRNSPCLENSFDSSSQNHQHKVIHYWGRA